MARNFVPASSQKLSRAAATRTTLPMTYAAWVRPNSVTGNHYVLVQDQATVSSNWFLLALSGAQVQAYAYDGTNVGSAITAAGSPLAVGTWGHVAAVFTSGSSRTAYLNGANAVTDVTTVAPTGINETNIGVVMNAGTPTGYFDGDIAEVAIWNVALDAAELAALAAGVCPLLVRPTALIAYWPLIGQYSPEIDVVGRFELTLTNTPVAAPHCRILYPDVAQWKEAARAAGVLAGDTTLTFTPAAALAFGGRLAGDTTLTFTPTGQIAARSQLAGDTSLTFAPAGDLLTDIRVLVNGTQVKAKRYECEILDRVNQGPMTASLVIRGVTPAELQEVQVLYAGTTIFDGQITSVEYVRPKTGKRVWYRLDCTQWGNLFDRRLATDKTWTTIAANTVVTDILSNFTSGFTSTNVQGSLATISMSVSNERPWQAVIRAAQLVGALCKLLTTKDVYFRTTSNLTAPSTLDTTNKRFRNLRYRRWTEQVRTRIFAYGASTSCPVTMYAGSLSFNFANFLPVVSAAAFSGSASGCTPYALIGGREKAGFSSYTSVGTTTPPTTTANAAVGATSISVSSTPTGFGPGWLNIGGQYIYCTAFSGVTISGIPATNSGGAGAIVTAIPSGTVVQQQDSLSLSGATLTTAQINAGDSVQLTARVDDTTAQTALAALEGGDGIHEFPVTDTRLDSFAKLITLATGELSLGKNVLEEAKFTSEDLNAVAGANQTITIDGLSATLPIVSVRIYWMRGRRRPQRDCVATTLPRTLMQFLTELFDKTHAA